MLNIPGWLKIASCSVSVGGGFFFFKHQIKESDSMTGYDMISSVILIPLFILYQFY